MTPPTGTRPTYILHSFFFSSRRRHTRCSRDWSSDVCSSDLELACMTQQAQGPVAYGSCLNKQINALRSSPGIPSLSGLDDATRQSIELACMTQDRKSVV